MSRWIRVQTSIFDHELFAAAELSQREAWLWLIANVAWKETRHRVGNEVLDVPVGSMFATLRSLQSAWRWGSDKRVRTFLSMLEKERMIKTKTDAGKTQITVCNYSRYQDVGRTEDASGTQAGRSADALKTPIHQDTSNSSLRSESIEKETRERADFDSWISSWPSQASDDHDDAFRAWCDLSDEERAEAKRLSSAYVEQAKGGGRTVICAAAKYLRQRMWKRVQTKPPDKPPKPGKKILTREEYLAAELRRSERSFQR
ncbi:hypothetical protein [Shinella fusca]|uniref:Uncharacterized protein n=1 Tax=Shinella fusca TaxID=544480 RepID=A0A7W7YR47_9HYPH|nr:hypothetical protein [Shinella fusca]MBB5040823.1 hypothetical protein [Shinella fusca]